MKLYNYFLPLFFGLYSITSVAEVSVSGNTITVQGKLLNADADNLVELMNSNSISTVVFKNSAGGEWRAGMRIGNFLAARNITTLVEGVCASACALSFLGGEKRQFSRAGQAPILFFHVPYSASEQTTIENLKPAFFSWIESRTKRKIDPIFANGIDSSLSVRGGVFFFSSKDPIVKSQGGVTQICKGNEFRIPLDCEKMEEISALSMGIVDSD
ncbi:hypothetical protein [Undibacterium curvum]|uniref:Uncharacterized protein n=1 Tax=Undibacterium curvum TaxID=2762294 RepID=A0ABR7A9N1_9BURK|nr:hypothetical protein [Undibacterium curvum]MBC3933372.1 hypothetical protein [Undibacterium curvum]